METDDGEILCFIGEDECFDALSTTGCFPVDRLVYKPEPAKCAHPLLAIVAAKGIDAGNPPQAFQFDDDAEAIEKLSIVLDATEEYVRGWLCGYSGSWPIFSQSEMNVMSDREVLDLARGVVDGIGCFGYIADRFKLQYDPKRAGEKREAI